MTGLPPEANLVVGLLMLLLFIVVAIFCIIYVPVYRIQKKLLFKQSEKRKGTFYIFEGHNNLPDRSIFVKHIVDSNDGQRYLPNGTILLKFKALNCYVEVYFRPGTGDTRYPAETRVHIPLPKSIESLIFIKRKSVLSNWYTQSAYSFLDIIKSGNQEFDRAYMIFSNNESLVQQLLTSSIQNNLLSMKKKKLNVSIDGADLDVYYVLEFLRKEKEYDQLIDLSLQLLQRITQ